MLHIFIYSLSIVVLVFCVNGQQSIITNSSKHHPPLERLGIFNQLVNSTFDLLGGFSSDKETIGNVVFNVHHFTQFLFEGQHVYIYSPKKNDENINQPQKWTFFYVPILQPIQASFFQPWVTINKFEVRVRLALGTAEVEAAARQAIANQFSPTIAEKYSRSWVIAPLMLDSLSAYIVTVGSTPIPAVAPFHIDNPNSNILTLRFVCLIKEVTLIIAAGLLTGDFDLEISLHFSGMHRVRTNMLTITATNLQSILSKTKADGGNTNATYIHRDQANSFIAKYLTNVKKMIYIEDSNVNTSILTHGLEEQFSGLFQSALAHAKQVSIKANAYGQVWQSADLNPDRITNEMSKIFTFNETETKKRNNKENYYSINQRKDCIEPNHIPLDVIIRNHLFTTNIYLLNNNNNEKKANEQYKTTNQNAVSESDIQKAAALVSIEGSWYGKKFIPKSFQVFHLLDVVDRLQVAVIAKQLLAEKANGAVIRRVGASNLPLNVFNIFPSLDNDTLFASLENISVLTSISNLNLSQTNSDKNYNSFQNVLTGEIRLYASSSSPPSPWLICDGSIISREEYPRLFSVIGTKYGGDVNSTMFRLPDLRGRVPFGVDTEQIRLFNATDLGLTGGQTTHKLSIEQIPPHVHDSGTYENSYNGEHAHKIYDPGHNHGGSTNTYAVPSKSSNNYGEYIAHAEGYRQFQAYTIGLSYTQISLGLNGNHSHEINGHSGSVGQGQAFSILPPYQTFYYIIYAN